MAGKKDVEHQHDPIGSFDRLESFESASRKSFKGKLLGGT